MALRDVQTALINVRFEGKNGHDATWDAMSAHLTSGSQQPCSSS
jgi:hypothetical protein